MKTAATLALLSSLIVLVLAAFTTGARSPAPLRRGEGSSFRAEIHGDLHMSPAGAARFGMTGGRDRASSPSRSGPTVRTARSCSPGPTACGWSRAPTPSAGRDDGSDEIMALVMTGTASRPTGVFRGHSGYLIITSATDNVLRGRFEVDATGFLASDPENEGRPIRATGMFTATRQ